MVSDVSEPQVVPPARLEISDRSLQQALLDQNFSPFWKRFVAVILDGLFLRLFAGISGGILAESPFQEIPFIDVLYAIGFIAAGATPGMHLLGIRVIDGVGNPPGVKRSSVRYIIPALSWLPLSVSVERWFFP